MTEWGGQHADEGFTLVELLVSISLLALLLVMMTSAIQTGLKMERTTDTQTVTNRTQPVRAFLLRLLSETRPTRSGNGTVTFTGRTDRIDMISSYVPQGQVGGVYCRVIEYVKGPNASGSLRLKSRLCDQPESNNREDTLLTGIKSMQIRYFGSLDGSGERRWHTTWSGAIKLPALVELSLNFGDEKSLWPPLVTELALAN